MSLPHGAVGWSAVCVCGISWLYFLLLISSHKVFIGFLFMCCLLCMVICLLISPESFLTIFIIPFIDIPMFNVKYLTMHNVQFMLVQ